MAAGVSQIPGLRAAVQVAADGSASARAPQLLRLLTCGSVDDGKSTLIGRLLYDCRAVFADQIAAIEKASLRRGEEKIDLSLFTDGLRWEREQGITIDVAHRYFSTATRRYILIDSPGHVQYTRNMVTGASHADLAVILVDARHGVREQTHRHAYLAALLGIRSLIVAVNKMDLVGWERGAFEGVREAFEKLRPRLHGADVQYVPVSALLGDNICSRSERSAWYVGGEGRPLLAMLESAPTHYLEGTGPARFPVQYVIRPRGKTPGEHDFRGFAGQMASGTLRVGDRVAAASSGRESTIESIRILDKRLEECRPPQSVVITLADDIDIGRGEMLTRAAEPMQGARELTATVVWMGAAPLTVGRRYLLRHTTHFLPAVVASIESRLDIHTLRQEGASGGAANLVANEIGVVRLKCASPVLGDVYDACRATGSFVLIDEVSNETSGAGLITFLG